MKYLATIILSIIISSCQKGDDSRHLHFQLKIFRNDLVETINFQDQFIQNKIEGNEFFLKRYKVQKTKLSEIRNAREIIDYKNRKKVLYKRDSINEILKLNLNFAPSDTYKNIEDSIFKKLIEIDFLRITKAYQNNYMFPPTEKMYYGI